MKVGAVNAPTNIAKSVFEVHGVDANGHLVIRRQLKRRYVLAFFQELPRCLIGIEACATSRYWSRQLQALGHTVRLMPPAYVKPYVKRQKNDAADAEATCEAKLLYPGNKYQPTGYILTTVLGIVGALVATYLGQAVGWYKEGQEAGFIGAIVGAIIILAAWGFIAPRLGRT